MPTASVRDQVLSAYDTLPGQLRAAARWMLDHGDDVALLSMRELARKAEVTPATMTRLAQRLGYDGFEAIRQSYADEVRSRGHSFTDRTMGLLARRDADRDGSLVTETLTTASGHLEALSRPETVAAMGRAADLIVRQQRVFCIGARSSFPAIYLAWYLLSLIGERAMLVEGAGSTSFDLLRDLGKSDALLALTIAPYTKVTVDAVAFAAERKTQVIAISDSLASPIARQAEVAIVVPTDTPSFLQTMAPAFIVAECLASLVAARRGKAAVRAIAATEAHLDRFGRYAPGRHQNGRQA